MAQTCALCWWQVATDNLAKVANSFEFSRENYEPLVQTCMTTLSSKV